MTTPTKRETESKTKRKRMVRKQVYILPKQEEQLKRLAEQRAVTEAELIREALEGLLQQPASAITAKSLPPDEAAWQALLASMYAHRSQGIAGKPHRWTREDYYDDERSRRLYGSAEPA